MGSFNFSIRKISEWKSRDIFIYSNYSSMRGIEDPKPKLSELKNGRLYVYLQGNRFQQNEVIIPNNNNVINIYCVYELEPYLIQEILHLQFKMLYLVLWKLPKTNAKDMAYVLMKVVQLVRVY